MFVLESKIEIGNLVFNEVVDVKITRSVDVLSDTAVIKLPTSFVLKDTNRELNTSKAILSGNPVSIRLGYKDKFSRIAFTGVVTTVKPTTPVEIHCEDAVWHLRRTTVNKAFTNTTLKDILREVVKKTNIKLSNNIPDAPIKKYLIKDKNGAQALHQIKQDFALNVFLDDQGKLFAGLQQTEGAGKQVTYDLEYNIVSHNLQFVKEGDIRVKIVAKAILPDNTRIEVVVGDLDGEQRTWTTHSIDNKETLEKFALSRLQQAQYVGLGGTITGFLIPFADRGMTAQIIDERYPEREGKYFISKVVIHFVNRGARRIITLGQKVST
jgi:hypothetical protein